MKTTTIRYSDILVDTAAHQVRQSGKPVTLTDTEYRLLVYLLRHRGVVCKRNDIIDDVFDCVHGEGNQAHKPSLWHQPL